jgi:hypothetical protein
MSKANAGVITKVLKANGYERALWRKVGVSTWTAGFDTEQGWNGVSIQWLTAGSHRDFTGAELQAVKTTLTEIADTLSGYGYVALLKGEQYPYLLVNKAD